MRGAFVRFCSRGGNPINSEYELSVLGLGKCRVRIYDDGRVEAPFCDIIDRTIEECTEAIRQFEMKKLDEDIERYKRKAEGDSFYIPILKAMRSEAWRRNTCPECGGSKSVRLGPGDGGPGVCGNRFHEPGVFWVKS